MHSHFKNGSLAQLNRASDYGSEGCRFESCRSHFQKLNIKMFGFFFLYFRICSLLALMLFPLSSNSASSKLEQCSLLARTTMQFQVRRWVQNEKNDFFILYCAHLFVILHSSLATGFGGSAFGKSYWLKNNNGISSYLEDIET